jgi:uncharacterized membrane protein YeaQ/YmgE (transglycosylase-associated protein family)
MDDPSTIFFILILAGLVCGFIGHYIGKPKERAAEGFWLGFLLGPIGIIAEAILPDRRSTSGASLAARRATWNKHRKCPFCAELVLQEAVICRFCQRDLPLTTPCDPDPIFRTSVRGDR